MNFKTLQIILSTLFILSGSQVNAGKTQAPASSSQTSSVTCESIYGEDSVCCGSTPKNAEGNAAWGAPTTHGCSHKCKSDSDYIKVVDKSEKSCCSGTTCKK